MTLIVETKTDTTPVRILLGGFVSTVIVTMIMYVGARMMLGAPMDIAGELSKMLGMPWAVGMVMHFFIGTVVFAFAYALIVGPRLPANAVVRGVIWGAMLWLVAMLVMSPMMGKGFFMGAVPVAMASLMGHLVMGVVLALIVPVSARR